ncbi:OLC1v1016414C1 [Oldenlandia corymbosa var. corymbosa]|uniref:OLC1v1016414C1 n=1 Tax=Oldenlandia corymbosa var. corymbosa TaxID=529605 RepID=A0AAV1E6Z3_OLDCO|nr:OLC1v1016414C1 [Oldenlandia corymbosa var. corymbosa]
MSVVPTMVGKMRKRGKSITEEKEQPLEVRSEEVHRSSSPSKEGFKLEDVELVPVWVQLPKLQVKYWSARTLSRITSVLGKPLEMDEVTTMRNRAAFARVLVEMKISDHMLDAIWFEDENGILQEQKVKKPIQKAWKQKSAPVIQMADNLEKHTGKDQESDGKGQQTHAAAITQVSKESEGATSGGKLIVAPNITNKEGKQGLTRKDKKGVDIRTIRQKQGGRTLNHEAGHPDPGPSNHDKST